MEMIQFGAANVFRASDGDGSGDLSAIDIDAVLSHGEKRTKEVMDQLEALGSKGEDVSDASRSPAPGVVDACAAGALLSCPHAFARARFLIANRVARVLNRCQRAVVGVFPSFPIPP